MSIDFEEIIETRAKWYANFGGILIGFSITIAVLIVALANEEIVKSLHYGYSLAAFIYSALAFFSTYTWYGRATEKSDKQKKYYLYGSIFYYTGYWSILLGLIYLTSLIQIKTVNYAFFISLAFLSYTFIINLYESVWEILKREKLNGIILLVLLIVFIIISVLTIPVEPFLALMRLIMFGS